MDKCSKQGSMPMNSSLELHPAHTVLETSSSPAAQAKGSHGHGAIASSLMYHPA